MANSGKPLTFLLLPFVVAVWPGRAAAVEDPLPAARPDRVLESVRQAFSGMQRFTLRNGLRVVLAPSHLSPTIGISVTYGVGSSAEQVGRSGFAHLFEHLMFEGSKHAPKGQHFSLIAARGGILNGTTDADRTNFYEELPAGELALGLWLESDRLRYLNVTRPNFENQRAVVEEEFRMSVGSRPYAPAELRLGELVFADYPPYAHPTIGSLPELEAAKLAWVQDFHQRYYVPENAVLCLTGDFEAEAAKRLVETYFTTPTPSAARARPAMPEMPKAAEAIREAVDDPNAATPALLFGFLIPPARTRAHYALELLTEVLAGAEGSPLRWSLIHDRATALDVSAWCEGHRGPDQLTLQVVLSDAGAVNDVEAAINAELARMRDRGPRLEELLHAQKKKRAEFLLGLQTNLGRAIRLGEFESEYGDSRLLADELKHYLNVTPDDLRSAAQRYLLPERAVIVQVRPAGRPTSS